MAEGTNPPSLIMCISLPACLPVSLSLSLSLPDPTLPLHVQAALPTAPHAIPPPLSLPRSLSHACAYLSGWLAVYVCVCVCVCVCPTCPPQCLHSALSDLRSPLQPSVALPPCLYICLCLSSLPTCIAGRVGASGEGQRQQRATGIGRGGRGDEGVQGRLQRGRCRSVWAGERRKEHAKGKTKGQEVCQGKERMRRGQGKAKA